MSTIDRLKKLVEDEEYNEEGLELLEEYTEYVRTALDNIEDAYKAKMYDYSVADDIADELNRISEQVKKLLEKLN